MKKRSSFRRLAAIAAGSVVLAGAIALLGTGDTQGASSSHSADAPLVLQGHVIGVGKDSITIRTPDIRPTPEPGKATPMFIMAGKTFSVDVSHAKYESPTGMLNGPRDLATGDPVVIVCDRAATAGGATMAPSTVTARVIEKLRIPLAL